jgi:hypothetical protein
MTHDMTCGTCHRTWSSVETPTPAARCPFENLHVHEETMTPISSSLYERYKFFHEYAGWCTPPGKVACALALARIEERAAEEGLVFMIEDDDIPWDGDCPAPKYLLWCAVYLPGTRRPGDHLAGLGGVGVDSLSDPYLRVVAAELYAEALAGLDRGRNEEAEAVAAELGSRATYAGVAP